MRKFSLHPSLCPKEMPTIAEPGHTARGTHSPALEGTHMHTSPGTPTCVLTRTPMQAHIVKKPCSPTWHTDVQACSLHAHTPQGQGCPDPSALTCDMSVHIPTGLHTPHRAPWWRAQCLSTQLEGKVQARGGWMPCHAGSVDVQLCLGLGP